MTFTEFPIAWLPLADAAVKTTLILLLAAAVSVLLRGASAAFRHLIWTLALVSALLLPVLSFSLPKWHLPLLSIVSGPPAAVAGVADEAAAAPPVAVRARRAPVHRGAEAGPAPAVGAGNSTAATLTWQSALFALWIAGALCILARIVIGLAAVRWLSRRTQEITDAPWLGMAREIAIEMGVGPNVRFLRGGRATMPIATGIFRPSIVMPSDADTWSASRLRVVVLHELAHVRRRDCLTHLLAQAACAFHWFNPLAWLAVTRARTERERACDDLVLSCGTRGSEYADQLLEMARLLRGDRFPALLGGASLAMANRSQLEGRLIAILDPRVPRAGVSRGRGLAAVLLCGCAVAPLGALQPWASAESNTRVERSRTAMPAGPAQAQSQQPVVLVAGREGTAATPRAQTTPPAQAASPHAAAPVESVPHPAVTHALVSEAAVHAAMEAAAELIENARLDERAEAEIQEKVATAAGKSGRGADPKTVAALTAALKDTDEEVRETAMQALVQMRDPSIFEPLVQALKDAAPGVREQAAFGLGQLRDRRAVQPLVAALKDTDKEVREAALHALVQLRDPASVDPLMQALKDASAEVREQAAFGLGQLRDRRAVPGLVAALKDENASVREQAVFALGQLRDPLAVEAVTAAVRDTHPGVREQAVFALGQIRDKRAVEALISALKDSHAKVREQAAFGLGQLRDPRAVEALIIAVRDPDPDVREQVVFALGQLRDPRAIDALMTALKDQNADIRKQAAFSLGQLAR